MWEVEGEEGNKMYLGGTCHILRKSDYPLPVEYDQAYAKVKHVVLEADLDEANNPELQQTLMAKGMYMDGTTVDKVLSEEAYQALQKYCQDSGMSMQAFMTMRVPLILLTISTIEMAKLGVTESGVDKHYQNKSKADGKKLEGLETVEEQMDFLLTMGKGNESEMLLATLRDLKDIKPNMTKMLKAWREGDDEMLASLIIEKMQKEYPKIYQTLFVQRNQNWQPKIEAYIKSPEPELVLVGAGHLVGEDGILHQLEQKGYKVKRFEAVEALLQL